MTTAHHFDKRPHNLQHTEARDQLAVRQDGERAFFSARFSRKLDALEYATFRRWRLYGEEALAGEEAAVSLQEKNLTLEYRGEPLSRYDVEYLRGTDRLEEIA